MVPDDLHKHLKICAVEKDTTMNDIILSAVKTHVDECCVHVNVAPDSAP